MKSVKIMLIFANRNNLDWNVTSCFPGAKLRDLIANVYEKASIRKMWWLVRHSAGMLGLKSDELAKVMTV